MKRILLPTDFSENAHNAIVYAIQLLKNEPSVFYLLHTYTIPMVSAGSMMDSYSALALQETAQNNATKKMEDLVMNLKNKFPNNNHTFKTLVSFNLFISEMMDLVETEEIDFVVMGTQGATGAKEVFLGTNTMYAIKKMKIPVLAVPDGFEFTPPKEILFPTDFKFHKDNNYLDLLRDFCTRHVSRLHILNAYHGTPYSKEQEETKSFLDSFFKGNAHLFHLAEQMDVTEAVNHFQINTKINFIAMIHNKHNFFENLLFRPVINQVVYHTNVPFLVIPSKARQV